MLWKNKNTERITELEEKLDAKLDALTQRMLDENGKLAEVSGNLDKLQRLVQEQGMSIEDLLEEWSERTVLEDELRMQLREDEEEEQHLLQLFEAYQEQFHNLQRFARGRDEAWTAQIAMMERSLEHYRQACGISLIGECGTEVDYDMHEVIEAIETAQPDQDRKIADVYRGGYLYKGKIKRKAQVAAYKFRDSDEAAEQGMDNHTEEGEKKLL